jgi:glycosyltransferase involved in cell wall biosynthesis
VAQPSLELTILMPCLDEAETLATCIRKAMSFLARTGIAGEVLVADNGSIDGSPAIAVMEGARVVNVPQRGYGAALSGGIEHARGRYIIMGDADDSYDFSKLELFVEKLRQGYELVMGDRFAGGIAPGAMPWLHRYIGNPILSFVGRLFFKTSIRDFHCGLRGFNRDSIRSLKLRTSGMEFASEMVVKATFAKLRIAEVPTTLSPDGRTRSPHLRSFRDGWRHLRFLLLFSPRWLFLYPAYFLLAVGVFLGALLVQGPVFIGDSIELDLHAFLLAAMFILVGLQAFSFAIIARRFATRYGLIPPSQTFETTLESLTLERVLVFAAVMTVLGLAALLWGLSEWAERGFGHLNASTTLRVMIVALTALVAGIQLMLAGFLASLLDVPVYEGRVIPPPEEPEPAPIPAPPAAAPEAEVRRAETETHA